MNVWNLTKHPMTADQLAEGGINVTAAQAASHLQDFTANPSDGEMASRAKSLMQMAADAGAKAGDGVMLAGAMYFILPLIVAAKNAGFVPTFSFTQRVAVEKPMPDGAVKLEYVFKHEGWKTV